jgi:hypothetical protein
LTSLSGLDFNTVVSAAATLLAIWIGYQLSKWTEHRQWERRKTEQLRERQLASLISLIGEMQQVCDEISKVAADLASIQTRIARAASMGGELESAKADWTYRTGQLGGALAGWLLRVRRGETEMRMLRYGSPGMTHVQQARSILEALQRAVASEAGLPAVDLVTQFSSSSRDLSNALQAILETAEASLRG